MLISCNYNNREKESFISREATQNQVERTFILKIIISHSLSIQKANQYGQYKIFVSHIHTQRLQIINLSEFD